MTKRDEIIEIAGAIKDCRTRLHELELRLDLLIGTSSQVSVSGASASVNGNRRSYRTDVLAIVNRDHERVFSEDELMEAVKVLDDKKPSFRSALSRLTKHGEIIRTGRKRYRSAMGPLRPPGAGPNM